MKFTEDQKQFIHRTITFCFRGLSLKCDGIEVSYKLRYTKELQLGIIPFLDEKYNSIWIDARIPHVAQKFMRLRSEFIQKKSFRDKCKRINKKRVKLGMQEFVKYDEKYQFYDWWTNTKSLIRHLEKTFTVIEFLP